MTNILGVSCYYHDSAAALIKDGIVVAAAEEERFSRKKHDNGFPDNAIDFVLEQGNIKAKDLDYVIFYEKPFLKFERIILSILSSWPKSHSAFRESMLSWLKTKLWIKSSLKNKLSISDDKILFGEHHLSHAASAFLCSPFEESAIVTFDGVGEWVTTTIGIGNGTEIKILKEIKFPHSLGLLYSAYTAFLGFEVNEGEYKVMGMAPYGKPIYVDKVKQTVNINDDSSFNLNMEYFDFHRSEKNSFSKKFIELFGQPRNPKDKDTIDQHYADIASSVQLVSEEAILKIVEYARKITGMKNLCMAGGVALNSKANGRIIKSGLFEKIYIQPAAGDSGGAIGAALYVYNSLLNKPRNYVMENAYLGKEYTKDEIKDFLDKNNINYEFIPNDNDLINNVVEKIKQGKVIGWFQGRFEWGPRALGNRSILADPRKAEMKDIVNTKIKFREPFRPFAPSVIIDQTENFFDIQNAASQYPPRFMLYVVPVKQDKQKIIPAVTHVDGTARLQTVFKDQNLLYYKLIERFGEETGVHTVLNTSFNLKGEPIVNTPENAWNTFSKSGMDTLVLGNFLIEKGIQKVNM